MTTNIRRGLGALAGAAILGLVIAPAELAYSGETKVDFMKDVKPVLEAACVKCHGLKDAKGRFRLDNAAAAFKGGEVAQKTKHAAIVPGKPDESLLVAFIEATEKDPAKHIEPMPPRKEDRGLTADERATLRRWIAEGAAWPKGATLAPAPEAKPTDGKPEDEKKDGRRKGGRRGGGKKGGGQGQGGGQNP